MLSAAKAILKKRAPHLYDVARHLRLKSEATFFKKYVAKHRFGGHQFSVVVSDRVAREWYDHDVERPSSFEFLGKRGLLKGASVFALGAHQAVVAMMLASEAGSEGSIVAVEGNRHNFVAGNRNLELNNIKNVTLLHAAVGRDNGQVDFSQSHNGMVASAEQTTSSQKVDSVNIDTLAKRFGAPDVVLLDIEGYEADALAGAPETLKSKCVWYVEVHGNAQLGRYGKSNANVIQFFDPYFDLFFSPDDVAPFVPWSNLDEIPADRFFLIALRKY